MRNRNLENPDFTALGDISLTLVCMLLLFVSGSQIVSKKKVEVSAPDQKSRAEEVEEPAAKCHFDSEDIAVCDGNRLDPEALDSYLESLPKDGKVEVSSNLSFDQTVSRLARIEAHGLQILATSGD